MLADPRKLLLRVLAMLLAGTAWAAEQTPGWPLERLMSELSKTPTGTIRFVEERHLQLLSEAVVIEGTLSYADGRLEKRTMRPEKELAVIENGRMRITSPARSRATTVLLSDFPALEIFVSSLRATLDGDLERLKRDFWVGYKTAGPDWRLTLTPLSEAAREDIRDVVVSGLDRRITSIEINESDGDRTVVRIRRD